jgi:integrase
MALAAFTPADPTDFFFSPRRVEADLHAEQAVCCQTQRYRSYTARNRTIRKTKPARVPSAKYKVTRYGQAIARACDRAFPPPAPLARRKGETETVWWTRLTKEQKKEVDGWRQAHHWHPNQLRHAHATQVRQNYGREAAQVALGHSKADVTQVYAERDQTLATKVWSSPRIVDSGKVVYSL